MKNAKRDVVAVYSSTDSVATGGSREMKSSVKDLERGRLYSSAKEALF